MALYRASQADRRWQGAHTAHFRAGQRWARWLLFAGTVPPRSPARSEVIVVSANRETIDGLQDYLSRAGLSANGRRSLLTSVSNPESTVVVLFPDDFDGEEVQSALSRLLESEVRTVVITREPRRFDAFSRGQHGRSAVVMNKPAWGFQILDNIHERTET